MPTVTKLYEAVTCPVCEVENEQGLFRMDVNQFPAALVELCGECLLKACVNAPCDMQPRIIGVITIDI